MLALNIFAMLLVGHALCDFPLQGDFLAGAKNHRRPMPGTPWWIALTAHALIQAGMVGLVTGNALLGVAEFCLHWMIDHSKCDGRFGLTTDQALHVACKILWAAAVVWSSAT